jgi:hypothetical protein
MMLKKGKERTKKEKNEKEKKMKRKKKCFRKLFHKNVKDLLPVVRVFHVFTIEGGYAIELGMRVRGDWWSLSRDKWTSEKHLFLLHVAHTPSIPSPSSVPRTTHVTHPHPHSTHALQMRRWTALREASPPNRSLQHHVHVLEWRTVSTAISDHL